MKEKLYTIPLNDAVAEHDECPLCFIERKLELDMLDFVLGSSSSYMESEIRQQTDEAGFCREHMKKMFDYGNTLGNALILKTHYRKIQKEMKETFRDFTPGKTSLLGRIRRTQDTQEPNAVSKWTRKRDYNGLIGFLLQIFSLADLKRTQLSPVQHKGGFLIEIYPAPGL